MKMNKEITKETTEYWYNNEGLVVKKVVTVEKFDLFVPEKPIEDIEASLQSRPPCNDKVFSIKEVKEQLGLHRGKSPTSNKPF
jgi:hypothetical protein